MHVVLVLAYLLAVAATTAFLAAGGGNADSVAGPGMTLFSIAAAVFAGRAATHPRLDRRTRRAWALMGISFAVLVTSYVGFAVTSNGPDPLAFPTVADGFRLLFVPILLAGLLMLPTRENSAEDRYKTALDIGMVLAGGAMLLWYLVVSPVLTTRDGQSTLLTVVATAYPILDLGLIAGATLVMIRTASSSSRRPALLLAAALFLTVIGDVYLSYQRAHTPGADYAGWQFLCWLTSAFLMALAASEQCRRAARHQLNGDAEPTVRPVPYLPYAVVALGYALLLLVIMKQSLFPYGGLAIGAVATTGLVVARQIVALRENYRLVVTDSLTGLANRALLRDRLSRAVERSHRTGDPLSVLLIDLNGFKMINDTYGHEAGDTMLVAFAHLLERSVRTGDTVARLGGDEFAIVLHGTTDTAAAVARRISAATETPVIVGGDPVRPRASIGSAVFGPGCDTVGELLHRADTEMYRTKRAAVLPPRPAADDVSAQPQADVPGVSV